MNDLVGINHQGKITMNSKVISPLKPEGNWLVVSNAENENAKYCGTKLIEASKIFDIPVNLFPIFETYKIERNMDNENIMRFIRSIPNIKNFKLVLVILCKNTQNQYAAIKNYLNSELGIVSQFALSDVFMTKNLSYFLIV